MGSPIYTDLEIRGRVYATAKEAAKAHGVAVQTVYKAVREGRLETLGLGRGCGRSLAMRKRVVLGAVDHDPVAVQAQFDHAEAHGWPDPDPVACQKLFSKLLLEMWNEVFPEQKNDESDIDYQERLGIQIRRSHAAGWFGTKDFYIVCSLAGFEPDAVMHRFRTRVAACGLQGAA